MALARPRREEKEDPGAGLARDRAALVRLELEERAALGVARSARDFDLDGAVDDEQEGPLLDLVVTERLARFEHDEDRAGSLVRLEHDRRAAAAFGLDLSQVPAL